MGLTQGSVLREGGEGGLGGGGSLAFDGSLSKGHRESTELWVMGLGSEGIGRLLMHFCQLFTLHEVVSIIITSFSARLINGHRS